MKLARFVTLVLIGAAAAPPMARGAPNESSFLPESIRVPIEALSLRNSVTGADTHLYECAGSPEACRKDLANPAELAALFTGPVSIDPGSYDQLEVKYYCDGASYDALVRGSVTLGSTLYYTKNNTDILTTVAAEQGAVALPFSGCATRYSLATPVSVSAGDTINVTLLTFNRAIAWARLGARTLPGCVENAGRTRSLCMAYPDLVPIVGDVTPIPEIYGILDPAAADDSLGSILLLIKDLGTGNLITGMTRRYFSATSAPFSDGFDTALKRVSANADGSFLIENYGGTATGPGYLRFDAFRRENHNGTVTLNGATSRAYRAVSLGTGDGGSADCTPNPSPSFTAMFTTLSDLRAIVPLGTPASGGEIKERHQVQIITSVDGSGVTSGRNVPIIAAAPARLVGVRHFRTTTPAFPYEDDYYGFTLEFSCEVTARFDHIRTAGAKLLAATAGLGYTSSFVAPAVPTTFAAGEIIGFTDGTPPAPPGENRAFAFDYALYNSTHENIFANTERYRTTPNLAGLDAVCGNSYYSGSHVTDFNAKLGYDSASAGGDCRSASRDVFVAPPVDVWALVGGWFRRGAALESPGWRLAIASEVDGNVRMNIHPFNQYFFPLATAGTVNLDPVLATGASPYCYSDGASAFWFLLSDGGMTASMEQRAGACGGTAPAAYSVIWER